MRKKSILLILIALFLFSFSDENKPKKSVTTTNSKPALVSHSYSTADTCQCVQKPDVRYLRHPYYLPAWVWNDQRRSAFIDKPTRSKLDSNIVLLNKYNKLGDSFDFKSDSVNFKIDSILAKNLALIDITSDAEVTKKENINIALKLDPNFTEQAKSILRKALDIYTELALREDIIEEAFQNSIESPTPMPPTYSNNTDSTYTDGYTTFLKLRVKPRGVKEFQQQLKNAFNTITGDPALLVITSYKGDCWWGRTYYSYYYNPDKQLSRLLPGGNYLYISLNTDRLADNHNPAFWASKLGHEILHSLSYWHPIYCNAEERNKNNVGANKAFIVAYEFAILKRAEKIINKK